MIVVHLKTGDSTKYFSYRPSANEAAQTPAGGTLGHILRHNSRTELLETPSKVLRSVYELWFVVFGVSDQNYRRPILDKTSWMTLKTARPHSCVLNVLCGNDDSRGCLGALQ